MVFPRYLIRLRGEVFNPHTDYVGEPNLFSIELHHGGTFTKFPGITYVNGKKNFVDLLDIDKFDPLELDDVLEKLGYSKKVERYYHFLIHGGDLDFGLQVLGNTADVINLSKYVHENKLIAVYCEHGITKLHTYFTSPSKVVIREIVEEPTQSTNTPSSRRLRLEWVEPTQSSVAPMVEPTQSSVAPMVEPTRSNVEAMDELTQSNVAPIGDTQQSFSIDYDAFINFDPFIDDYSYEPVVNDSSAQETHQDVNEGDQQGDDSDDNDASNEDSDYIVDKDDLDDDVDVDMSQFRLIVDEEVDTVNTSNEKEKAGDDVDVAQNLEFESGSDPDDPEYDRRKVVKEIAKKHKHEAKKKNFKHHFYIGETFASSSEVKEKAREHSVGSMRELKIVKNDKQRVRVACEGQLPLFNDNFTSGQNSGALEKEKACGVGDTSVQKGPKVKNKGGRGNRTDPVKYTCPWVFLVSKSKNSETWMVKTLHDEHTCLQSGSLKACTTEYLSKHVADHMDGSPKIPTKALQDQLQKKLELGISKYKTFRAKMKARGQQKEDYTHKYLLLRDYMQELLTTNPGTTVKLEVEQENNPEDETRVFKRVYVCLGELKKGFKAIGRDLLGLDGAFMKGPFPGQVLTAVGMDPNNGIYPLAYAIVEVECRSSWTWFLGCLADDLDLEKNCNFTFISDRQKGIVQAIETMFPSAEHRYWIVTDYGSCFKQSADNVGSCDRFCLRHIHENMKLKWRGEAYKNLLWKCATATTVQQFEKAMDELKRYNQAAHLWLSKIHPKHWSRSHFSGRSKSDVLLNNICEVFNKQLVDGRDLPILGALEFIREYIMRRIVKVLSNIKKCDGPLTPNAQLLLDSNKKEASKYNVQWNGGEKYQVVGPSKEQWVVDVKKLECTCRRWDLNGIPCSHAVAANWDMAYNGENRPTPEGWVSAIYRVYTWKKVYNYKVNPINGMSMWAKTNVPTTLLPPKYHTPIGRPKKKRIRAADEQGSSQGRMSKRRSTISCLKCGGIRHNQRTCKGQGSSQGGDQSASQSGDQGARQGGDQVGNQAARG